MSWNTATFRRHRAGALPGWGDTPPPPSPRIQQLAKELSELQGEVVPVFVVLEDGVAYVAKLDWGEDIGSRPEAVVVVRFWQVRNGHGEVDRTTAANQACGAIYTAAHEQLEEPFFYRATPALAEEGRKEFLPPGLEVLDALCASDKVQLKTRAGLEGDKIELKGVCVAFRTAAFLAEDDLNFAVAVVSAPDHDVRVARRLNASLLDLRDGAPFGSHQEYQDFAGLLLGDDESPVSLSSLVLEAREQPGADAYERLRNLSVWTNKIRRVLQPDNLNLDTILEIVNHEPAQRPRLEKRMQQLVLGPRWDDYEVRKPATMTLTKSGAMSVTLHLRSADRQGLGDLERFVGALPDVVRYAASEIIPVHEAVELLPRNLERWPDRPLQWLTNSAPDRVGRRWRRDTPPSSQGSVAGQVMHLAEDPYAIPLDLLCAGTRPEERNVLLVELPGLAEALTLLPPPTESARGLADVWWLDSAPTLIAHDRAWADRLLAVARRVTVAQLEDASSVARAFWMGVSSQHRPSVLEIFGRLLGGYEVSLMRIMEFLDGRLDEANLPEPDFALLEQFLQDPKVRLPQPTMRAMTRRGNFWSYVAWRKLNLQRPSSEKAAALILAMGEMGGAVLEEWSRSPELDGGEVAIDLWLADRPATRSSPPPGVDLVKRAIELQRFPKPCRDERWDAPSRVAALWQIATSWAAGFASSPVRGVQDLVRSSDIQNAAFYFGWDLVDTADPRRGWVRQIREAVGGRLNRSQWATVARSLPSHLQFGAYSASNGELVFPTDRGRS